MLRVEMSIGGKIIGVETALRIKGGTKKASLNTYRMTDGCEIFHYYGNGAAKLAENMMRHLHECKNTREVLI